MQQVENAMVRVYLADGYWKTGVLHPYFEDPQPDIDKPMFFMSDNCGFDQASRCYVFRLAQLGSAGIIRDVYIPERFVVGVAVRQVNEPPEPERDRKKFGFAFEPRPATGNLSVAGEPQATSFSVDLGQRNQQEPVLEDATLRDLLHTGYETSDADFVAHMIEHTSRTVYFMAHFLSERQYRYVSSVDLQDRIKHQLRASGLMPPGKFNPVDWFSEQWTMFKDGRPTTRFFKEQYVDLFDRGDTQPWNYRIKPALHETVVMTCPCFLYHC